MYIPVKFGCLFWMFSKIYNKAANYIYYNINMFLIGILGSLKLLN